MKLMLHDEPREPIVKIWLEKQGEKIVVKGKSGTETALGGYNLLSFDPCGTVRRCRSISTSLGFRLDPDGRIVETD